MMEYIKNHKKLTAVIAAVVIAAIVAVSLAVWAGGRGGVKLMVREHKLERLQIDAQGLFDDFEDVVFTQENSLFSFDGTKSFDMGGEESVRAKYNLTYDAESKRVTAQITMYLPDGSVEVDTIEGAAFENEDGDLDAVMDFGEGCTMLLSEMRDAGMVANTSGIRGIGSAFLWVAAIVVSFIAPPIGIVLAVAAIAATATEIAIATNHTIILDKNGGVGGDNSITSQSEDKSMNTITPPTREGYTFIGYYDKRNAGTQYIKSDGTSAKNYDCTYDITLYAHWQANIYTVTLDAQGGVITDGVTSISATYGKPLPSVAIPTREGYTFLGYFDNAVGGVSYIDANGEGAKYDEMTFIAVVYVGQTLLYYRAANTTLFAQWAKI